MISKKDLLRWVDTERSRYYTPDINPIYSLMLFENPDKELIYDSGKASGFPNIGHSYEPGYYYALDDAIEAMHNNTLDVREHIYNAGFVICRFPGVYNAAGTNERLYFLWDDNKQGFFEAEEPEIFRHMAY